MTIIWEMYFMCGFASSFHHYLGLFFLYFVYVLIAHVPAVLFGGSLYMGDVFYVWFLHMYLVY